MTTKSRLLIATSIAAAMTMLATGVTQASSPEGKSAVAQAQKPWGLKDWVETQSRDERDAGRINIATKGEKFTNTDREDRDATRDGMSRAISAAHFADMHNPKKRNIALAQEDWDANSKNARLSAALEMQKRGYGTKEYEESQARDEREGPALANGGFAAMAVAMNAAMDKARPGQAKVVHETIARDDKDVGAKQVVPGQAKVVHETIARDDQALGGLMRVNQIHETWHRDDAAAGKPIAGVTKAGLQKTQDRADRDAGRDMRATAKAPK